MQKFRVFRHESVDELAKEIEAFIGGRSGHIDHTIPFQVNDDAGRMFEVIVVYRD